MNRVIKFRAWSDRKKKMIFGPTGDNPSPSWIIALPQVINSEIPVMQFTGVMDANGKEIYEGDVVELEGFEPFAVMELEAGWRMKNNTRVYDLWDHAGEQSHPCKVIGNVWENPELVKL